MPVSWNELKQIEPELAARGEERLHGRAAFLATVRKDGSARVFPVMPFTDGESMRLFVGGDSPKRFDLLNDGRYALHCSVEDLHGGNGEIHMTGEAVRVVNDAVRERAVAAWPGLDPVQDSYLLFELRITSVMHTEYRDGTLNRRTWSDESQ